MFWVSDVGSVRNPVSANRADIQNCSLWPVMLRELA
jgi:hypothetical protein